MNNAGLAKLNGENKMSKFEYRQKVLINLENSFYKGLTGTVIAREVKNIAMQAEPVTKYLVQIDTDFEMREWYNERDLEKAK